MTNEEKEDFLNEIVKDIKWAALDMCEDSWEDYDSTLYCSCAENILERLRDKYDSKIDTYINYCGMKKEDFEE